jgi:hypothetical protein
MAFKEVVLTKEEVAALSGKFWKPKMVGDKLLGFFVKYEQRQHDFGPQNGGVKTLHSYTFQNKEGAITHDANPDLHRKLQKAMKPAAEGGLGLTPGQRHACSMTYSGDLDTGQESKMKMFRLEVDTDFKAGAAPPPPPPPPPATDYDDIPF